MAEQRPFGGRVIFDHLPKTAGQAINAWLVHELGAGCVTTNLIGEHRTLIRRYGGAYSVISAHVDFHGEGLDPRYQYITCFREPLDRAISWLFFVANNHDETQLGATWIQASRFLETDGDELGADFSLTLQNPYVEHFASIAGQVGQTDAEKLAAALAAIEQYDVWGLYEDMPDFLRNVAAFIGLSAPSELQRVNVTRTRPSVDVISLKLRQRLQELNALDLELYRLLRERWQQRQQQPAVSLPKVSLWLPYASTTPDRVFASPEFSLLTARLDGDAKVVRGQVLAFTLEFSVAAAVDELEIGIHIFDEDRQWAFGTNTTLLEKKLLNVQRGTHRLQYFLVLDLPEGAYTAGFAFAERHAHGNRELGWFDRLADFSVTVLRPQACVGYTSMPVEVSCWQTSDAVLGLVEDAAGTIRVNAVLGDLAPGEALTLPVLLENASAQIWAGSRLNPIQLSYHWLDSAGCVVLLDGARTPLPVAEVRPGQSVEMQMQVVAPATSGRFQLMLLPVQVGRSWFDQLGFTPAVLDVTVVISAATRRYPGADVRLFTQCGRRQGTALVPNEQEGFLLYGPYSALPAGRYVARLQGAFAEAASGAWVDVVCSGGALELARFEFSGLPPCATEIAVPFEMAVACNDLEVRLWVPAYAQVFVEALLIGPADALLSPFL